MPLIQEQIVTLNNWLSMNTFTNLVTIAEMTPGPIAINAATFVGTQIIGPLGAIVATIGCILPSCIIVTFLAYIYNRFKNLSILQGALNSLRPAVVAMIAKAGLTILISSFFITGTVKFTKDNISLRMIIYFIIAMILLRKYKWNPIAVMVTCGLLEVLFYICSPLIASLV